MHQYLLPNIVFSSSLQVVGLPIFIHCLTLPLSRCLLAIDNRDNNPAMSYHTNYTPNATSFTLVSLLQYSIHFDSQCESKHSFAPDCSLPIPKTISSPCRRPTHPPLRSLCIMQAKVPRQLDKV